MKSIARIILPGVAAIAFALAPVVPAMAQHHRGHMRHGHAAPHFGHQVHRGHARFSRHGNYAYYNGHRGYRHFHRGYREYNGYWFPPAAFLAGAIIGGILNN